MLDDNTKKRLQEIKTELIDLLTNTSTALGNAWIDLYYLWKEENPYEFIAYLQDGFKELPHKEILYNDPTDLGSSMFFDVVSMTVFISKSFERYERDTVAGVVTETHPDNKRETIRHYFEFIDRSKRFETAFTLLYNGSGLSGVLQGEHPIDIPTSAYVLYETLEKYSVESIFLLFTYWRITSDYSYLQKLVASTAKYIREYFKDYGNDPEMHLDWPIEKEPLIKQINILSRWFEIICIHTNGLMNVYKSRNWHAAADVLVDDMSFPPFISYFQMLRYKSLYPKNDNALVRQKAIYHHNYGVWVKTVDVMSILSQTVSIIFSKTDKEIMGFGVSREAILELSDNIKKYKEYFSGLIFKHKEFYDNMRQKYSFLVLDTYEHSAMRVNESINELIQFTSAVLSNNIEELLLAKQQFVSRLSGFLSEDQELMLNAYMTRVVEKIKEEVRKLDVYSILYANITNDFKSYAQHLLMYPEIFCSLVSAEYLYQQYVESKTPNDKFDYSCISIMYYMALEDFANKLLYTAYAINVLDENTRLVRNDYTLYVSHDKKFWDGKNHCYKKTCEIGDLGYLLCALDIETEYKKYLISQYPNIDIQQLKQYGSKLRSIAPRRNEAAHGGKLITYPVVCKDKQDVYNTSIDQSRGLIMELFTIVFP
ncbi:MAG: hypothetical protein II875_06800 [Clostridia bacterium]|nr:hypothetical protein [Clostridia bacterium]